MSKTKDFPRAVYTDDSLPGLHKVFASTSYMGIAHDEDDLKDKLKAGFRLNLDKPKRGPKPKADKV